MTQSNPQIEEQLSKLARLCCDSLDGGEPVAGEESDALLKSLLMSGYARQEGASLQADVESRVKQLCQKPAMHRGGALSGITSNLQEKFDELVRWESQQPKQQDEPKAANISSATDA
ncbi:hypothetical protein NHH03_08000 [Stieleria sp. TO1_6]|uniref:hypothetical protein n=1 Tax=Stieleria tagensis TaxID=2956795 RepID=UPI00209B8D40|nr:hypothetical protein [Stieleria tagensis]MCO8121674.1 hypothetical protein [Stieleria tagensis]